jgi:hypothetical protein
LDNSINKQPEPFNLGAIDSSIDAKKGEVANASKKSWDEALRSLPWSPASRSLPTTCAEKNQLESFKPPPFIAVFMPCIIYFMTDERIHAENGGA